MRPPCWPFLLGALLLTGCSTGSLAGDYLVYGIGGGGVYANAQIDKKADAGVAPPRSVLMDCWHHDREGRYQLELVDAATAAPCFAKAGWINLGPDKWERAEAQIPAGMDRHCNRNGQCTESSHAD